MSLAERLLLKLSRDPRSGDDPEGHQEWSVQDALDELLEVCPELPELVRGMDVADFGCGAGFQAVAMARLGARSVTGIEISAALLDGARELARREAVDDRVRFVEAVGEGGDFDLVVSQNSMEHFPDPAAMLGIMAGVLRPGGRLLIAFGQPWYSPYGAHMRFFTAVPWVHLIFPERAVMAARSRFRDDGARRYEEVEGGLNRMSLARFERLVGASGLRRIWLRFDTVKQVPAVARVPVLRELLVNRVACLLERPR